MDRCDDCGEYDSYTLECPECGLYLCSGCFDSNEGVCNVCRENEKYRALRGENPTK